MFAYSPKVIFLTLRTFTIYLFHHLGRLLLAVAEAVTSDNHFRARRRSQCEVRRILWLRRPRMNTSSGFATRHSHFEPPEAILNDKVVLYTADSDYCYFAELPESAAKLLSSVDAPFAHGVICAKAVRILRLPTDVFGSLVDDRLGPKLHHPVVLQNNQPRAGSTLLAQMVRRLDDRIMCVSEPGYMQSLRVVQKSRPRAEFLGVLSAAMRYSLRPIGGKTTFYIKHEGAIFLAEDISQVLPEVAHVWLDRRDLKKQLESIERMYTEQVHSSGPAQVVFLWANLMFRLSPKRIIAHWYSGQYKPPALFDNLRRLGANHSEISCSMLLVRQVLVDHLEETVGLKLWMVYEELLASPEGPMREICRLLQIDGDVEKACQALKDDSQAGSIYDKKRLAKQNIAKTDIELLGAEGLDRIKQFGTAAGYPHYFDSLF